MINQMKSRLAQLEERLKKVSFNHKQVHAECFPKDGSDGIYNKVGSRDWDQHPKKLYLNKSGRVIKMIRREMLAILYYNKIMETRQSTQSLISNTQNARLFAYEELDMSQLFPKTEEEIKRAKMTRLERMREFPEEQNYGMFSKEANGMVNDMMIRLISQLHGNKKIYEEQFHDNLQREIGFIDSAGHGEVYDTAVREVVLGILEKEIEKTEYNWSMELTI